MEILPISVLDNQDIPIFGKLNVSLGQLARSGITVGRGVVVTPPVLSLKTTLEHYDFTNKEVFEQTLTLVKKEIERTPIPDILLKELKNKKKYWVLDNQFKSIREVWLNLMDSWLSQIKVRVWKDGFYKGITEGLEPQIVIFINKLESFGTAFYDPLQDDVVINIKEGKIHPSDLKKIVELVSSANKKLIISHEYGWIVDSGVKLAQIMPYTPLLVSEGVNLYHPPGVKLNEARCAVKIFVDYSKGLTIETGADGTFLASEKIFSPEKPEEGFENMVLKLVELGTAFPDKPILFKLSDVSEGMGGLRGTLRLLHQKSLLDPILNAIDFTVNKKGLKNIELILPFARNAREIIDLKRELAEKKLSRRNSLKYWLEIAVPENIINLEDYLMIGIDGVIFNLDELLSHLTGFDLVREELNFYKKEISALIKFLGEPFRILHKAKLPILACGNLLQQSEILEFLIEKGVYGIVIEKHESLSMKDILYQMEKKHILSLR